MNEQTKRQKATELRNLVAELNELTAELEDAGVDVKITRYVPGVPNCKSEPISPAMFIVQITSTTNY